jgi:hypothetical protein
MTGASDGMSDRLLTVAEAAEILRTSERFPRRLIEERHQLHSPWAACPHP